MTETTEKNPSKNREQTQKALRNQRKIADIYDGRALDDIVVTGAKKNVKKPSIASLQLEERLEARPIEIKIKSLAEQKYDELIAQKTADMPDSLRGKAKVEVGLTIKDLINLGINPRGDLLEIIKEVGKTDRAAAEKLIPSRRFGDENNIVSKELAIAAINRLQMRNNINLKNKKRTR